jgi:hypothetical protein
MNSIGLVRKLTTSLVVALTLLALVATGVLLIADPASSEAKPTFGTIPDSAWTADGSIDIGLVPDYVGALDRSGNLAGFVRAADILEDDDSWSPEGPIPVVNDDLELVGHMVPDRGFVPLGQPFDSVEKIDVILYERSDDGTLTETVIPGG